MAGTLGVAFGDKARSRAQMLHDTTRQRQYYDSATLHTLVDIGLRPIRPVRWRMPDRQIMANIDRSQHAKYRVEREILNLVTSSGNRPPVSTTVRG